MSRSARMFELSRSVDFCPPRFTRVTTMRSRRYISSARQPGDQSLDKSKKPAMRAADDVGRRGSTFYFLRDPQAHDRAYEYAACSAGSSGLNSVRMIRFTSLPRNATQSMHLSLRPEPHPVEVANVRAFRLHQQTLQRMIVQTNPLSISRTHLLQAG